MILLHAVDHQLPKHPRVGIPQSNHAMHGRLQSVMIDLVKHVPVTFLGWMARVVAVKHGVHQPADGADDGNGPLLQCDHLAQAARLEHARHHEHVGASVDQVRQALFEADLEMAVGVVVEVVL